MQANFLNAALEQLQTASDYAQRAQTVAQSLQKPLTMDIALEAEHLLPGAGVLDTYFSAASNRQQVALEGLLDTIIEAVVKVIESIINAIKKFFAWLTGSDTKEETASYENSESKIKQDTQKAASQASSSMTVDDVLAGKADGKIDAYLDAHPDKAAALRKMLRGYPDQARAMFDVKSKYLVAVRSSVEFIENLNAPLQQTLRHLDVLSARVDRLKEGISPVTVNDVVLASEDIEMVWLKLDRQAEEAVAMNKAIQDAMQQAQHGQPLKFSELHKLVSDPGNKQLYRDSHLTIRGVGTPLERLSTALGELQLRVRVLHRDKPYPEMRKAIEALGQTSRSMANTLGSILKLVHEVRKYGFTHTTMFGSWVNAHAAALAIGVEIGEVK